MVENARDRATPIGAFLAALPAAPTRHAKTSNERGRAFRERQQQRESQLEERVKALKNEVQRLHNKRKLWEARCLHSKTSTTGSLVQTIYEYHRLFRHGLQEIPAEPFHTGTKRMFSDDNAIQRIRLQEEFIRRVIDPRAMVGSLEGPEASIVQWRRYTKSHAGIIASVVAAEVVVTSDNQEEVMTVIAQCTLRARFSRETFKALFPHVLSDETFLQRLIGKEIEYAAVKRFEFTSEGRIGVESVDVDFVGGLLNSGCTLADIATLMGGAAITPESMIVEVEGSDDCLDHQADAYDQYSAAETRSISEDHDLDTRLRTM